MAIIDKSVVIITREAFDKLFVETLQNLEYYNFTNFKDEHRCKTQMAFFITELKQRIEQQINK